MLYSYRDDSPCWTPYGGVYELTETEQTYRFVLAVGLVHLPFQFVVFSLEGREALHSSFPHARQRRHVATEKCSHLCLHPHHLSEKKEGRSPP